MNKKLVNKKKWGVGILLLLIIAVLMFLSARHYNMLGQTIERERSTYISEIRNQLVKNIYAEKEQQITLVNLYGQILSQSEPQHFGELNSLLSYSEAHKTGDEVFLADTEGNVYTLNGDKKGFHQGSLSMTLQLKRRKFSDIPRLTNRKNSGYMERL